MLHHSLYLGGQWEEMGKPPRSFEVKVRIGHGARTDLPQAQAGQSHVRLTHVRRLAGLFDGIDFATEHPARVGRAFLRNLVAQGTWELSLLAPP